MTGMPQANDNAGPYAGMDAVSRQTRGGNCRVSVLIAAASLAFVGAVAGQEHARDSPRLTALENAVGAGDALAVGAFWSEIGRQGTPLIEMPADGDGRMLVTFLWRAEPGQDDLNAGVTGNFTGTSPCVPIALERLAETDVWFRTIALEPNVRSTYGLAWPEGRTRDDRATYRCSTPDRSITYEVFPDPRSRKSIPEAYFSDSATESWFEGPRAPPETWLEPREAVPKGTVQSLEIRSEILGNTRQVSIYTPPGYEASGAPYPFFLVFDGRPYLESIKLPALLDNLIAEELLPPLLAVMVGNDDRNRELPPNPEFGEFIAEELLGRLRNEYALTTDPRKAVIGGASYGGLAATFIAYSYPHTFGNVLSQSGSYWWHPQVDFADGDGLLNEIGWLPRKFIGGEKLPIRFYLDAGSRESVRIVLSNRHFRDILQATGYEVVYREHPGWHTPLNWRAMLPTGLMALLGTGKGRRHVAGD